jgi:hypothetical protein
MVLMFAAFGRLRDVLAIWLKSNIQLFAERETICVCLNVSKLDHAQVGHPP